MKKLFLLPYSLSLFLLHLHSGFRPGCTAVRNVLNRRGVRSQPFLSNSRLLLWYSVEAARRTRHKGKNCTEGLRSHKAMVSPRNREEHEAKLGCMNGMGNMENE